MSPALRLVQGTDALRNWEGRDLTGCENGTKHPEGEKTIAATLVGKGSEGHPFQGLYVNSPPKNQRGGKAVWHEILARFEKQAPACVMARLALERAMPAAWVDEGFEANRQRQYPRELLFSTVVELMSLVSLGCALRCMPPRAR